MKIMITVSTLLIAHKIYVMFSLEREKIEFEQNKKEE